MSQKTGVKFSANFQVQPLIDSSDNIIGFAGTGRDVTEYKRIQEELIEQRNLLARQKEYLEAALLQVKQLEGIIPICSYCNKIRDDQQSWHQLETYICNHSEAKFSHGACPDCLAEQIKIIENMQ